MSYFCLCLFIHVISTSTCKSDFFMNRCENVIISTCYPSGKLLPYTGSVPFKYSADSSKLPTLSLREAAKTKKDQLKCNCTEGCKSMHCPSKGSGVYCTSHCHPKPVCTNKECHETADGDEECIVNGADDCDDKIQSHNDQISSKGDWLVDCSSIITFILPISFLVCF